MKLIKNAFKAIKCDHKVSATGSYYAYHGMYALAKAMVVCTVLVCYFFGRCLNDDQIDKIAESLDDV